MPLWTQNIDRAHHLQNKKVQANGIMFRNKMEKYGEIINIVSVLINYRTMNY